MTSEGSDKIKKLLDAVHEARGNLEARLDDVESAREEYHLAVRKLHAEGLPLREIADALGMSHQRVHQIITSEKPKVGPVKRAIRGAATGGAALMLLLGLAGGWFANESLDEPEIQPAITQSEPREEKSPKPGHATGSSLAAISVNGNCYFVTTPRIRVPFKKQGERHVVATIKGPGITTAATWCVTVKDH